MRHNVYESNHHFAAGLAPRGERRRSRGASPAAKYRARAPRHGFTLIELLVVVTIIALLIAILLPSLSQAIEAANRAVCSSNQRQVAVAMLTYRGDHFNSFPYQYGAWSGSDANFAIDHALDEFQQDGKPARPNWVWSTLPYINDQTDLLLCPSNDEEAAPTTRFHPDDDYAIAITMHGAVAHFGGREFKRPSSVAVTMDNPNRTNGAVLRPHWGAGGDPVADAAGWSGWNRFKAGTDITRAPHDGKVLAHMDGHVEYIAWPNITSGNFGLLINGQDTHEADAFGYDHPARIGRIAY